MSEQLNIIALIVKSENIVSEFVQDLRIIQMLTDSQLGIHNAPAVLEIIKSLK